MCADNWALSRIVSALGEESRDYIAKSVRDVVLFGGTFDPPHIGHLMMAQLSLEETKADELWFLPAPVPPHKQDVDLRDFETRMRMVETLVKNYPRMRVMPLEQLLPKPSYSVDTVIACKQWFPEVRFRFLLGSDSLAALPTWRRALELTAEIEFLVAVRTGFPFRDTVEQVKAVLPRLQAEAVVMPVLDVSSTWIRDRIIAGDSVCGLVPEAVLDVFVEVDLGKAKGEQS